VELSAAIRGFVGALVHASAREDSLTSARHRAFIAPRLLASLAATAAFPLYLTVRGVPSVLEIGIFAWLITPLLVAYFLSRTGQYERAHVLSALALTGFAGALAAVTGGVGSFAAIWLVVVPLEAALSASRRAVVLASAFSLAAAGLLILGDALELLPSTGVAQAPLPITAFGVVSAIVYATGLAFGAESLARTSSRLLTAEEDRYRLLACNVSDVITRHGRNGAVLFVSPAAEPLLGMTARDLLGQGLFDRVHVADRPVYLTALAESAAHGESRSVELRVRREGAAGGGHPAAHFIWVEMCCRPMEQDCSRDRAGGDREVVAVMRDITGRKEQEQAIERARAEAERANAGKSRFLATMSHELRTPLNAIIGFSEMLTKEDSLMIDAARRRDYAQLINESGHHLLSVVNDILDMSKMENGNLDITPEPFAPGEVIGDCCDLLALKARDNGIELVRVLPEDLPGIVADKRAFQQIMLNLLSNAVKFTNRNGRVSVSARRDGDCLAVVVEDNGVGIGAEDLPHIGDPFFQSRASYDRRHDGTGLGVSIVKGLLAQHGGGMEIASRLGEGTRVTVRLPLDCGRSGAAVSTIGRIAAGGNEQPNTLVRKRA
jgi:cell cycle sensor histidine kinase DivJ